MLNSIFRKAGKYLLRLSDRTSAAEPTGAPDSGRQFSEKARRIASDQGTKDRKLLAGSIRFLDLDQIKREFGVSWGQASAAAYAIVENTIRKHLSGNDCYANQKPVRAGSAVRAS